jgi:hypothetical protein
VRAVVVVLLCIGSVARADEKDVGLSVVPMYAVAYADGRTANGGGFWLDASYGISDQMALHVGGMLAWHGIGPDANQQLSGGAAASFAGMAGVSYSLDVLRLVPTFSFYAGAIGIRGGANFSDSSILKPVTAFGVGLGFALDYLVNRRVAIGVELRYQAAVTDIDRLPMLLWVGPRVAFRLRD